MKSLLCKCRSRVWILGTHMKGRPETENSGGRHRRSLRWSDCLHPPKSVSFEFSRRPHPNNEVQSTRERHHTSTADLQVHMHLHTCEHACVYTFHTSMQRHRQDTHTERQILPFLLMVSYGRPCLQTSAVLGLSSSGMNFRPICHIACSLYCFTLWHYYWVLVRFLSHCTSLWICPFKARGGPQRIDVGEMA